MKGGILGPGRGHYLIADKQNMYRETGRSRKISESPPPRGNHVEREIIHPFWIHDSTLPKIALQPSMPSKAEPGQAGLARAERSRAKPGPEWSQADQG